MNRSKKMLAALVAIPASVVVVGEVQAEESTLSFEIKNDFVNGASTAKQTIPTRALWDDVLIKLSEFNKDFSLNLDVSNAPPDETKLGYAKQTVEDTFNALKAKVNEEIILNSSVLDATILYGLLNNVKIQATEVKDTNGEVSTVKLDFKVGYLVDSSYITNLVTPTLQEINANYNVTTEILKLKAVHDYLVTKKYVQSSGNNLNNINSSSSGMSTHAYSMWTYLLLNELGVETKYVYGLARGTFTSWNIVKLDGEWYQLDVAGNDSVIKNDTDIQYRYFLTGDNAVGEREIYYGDISDFNTNLSLNSGFVNMVNPVLKNSILYYADMSRNGGIYKLDLNKLTIDPIQLATGMSSKPGSILVPGQKFMYFINSISGNNLYVYDLDANIAQLGIKDNVQSFSISGTNLTYKVEGDAVSRTISIDNGIDQGMGQFVSDKIKAVEVKLGTAVTESYRKDVLVLRKLYNNLTDTQKALADKFMKNTVDGVEKTNLELLEASILSTEGGANEVIKAINALDISKTTYIHDVESVNSLYENLSNLERAAVYNVSILTAANNTILNMTTIENKIQTFYDDNIDLDEEDRAVSFYREIKGLLAEYNALHPNLKRAAFNNIILGLQGLGDSEQAQGEISEIQNLLNVIHVESKNYLHNVKNLNSIYSKLTNAQKGLLSNEEQTLIENYLAKAETMEAVVKEFEENGYITTINEINNTEPLNPVTLTSDYINKINRINNLIKMDIKPSQWQALNITDSNEFIAKIEGFLKRVADAKGGLEGAAINVNQKIKDFDNKISDEIEGSTNTVDYENKFLELKETLEETNFAGSLENLEIILSMVPEASKIWDRHLKLSNGFTTKVTDFDASIQTLKDKTDRTLDDVNQLLEEYNQLDPIFKHYVKNFAVLEDMKREFNDKQDEAIAQVLINKMDALLLKNETVELATYKDTNELWDQYIKGSAVFKSKVEDATNFAKFKTLWEKLKADVNAEEAKVKEVKDLIEKINDAISQITSDTTKEALLAIQEEYELLVQKTSDEEAKVEIKDYIKVANALKALEDKEKNEATSANRAAADKVIQKIAQLNDDSTPEEIEAIREEYEALSDEAQEFITKSHLNALEFYEKRLEALTAEAKKEAAVVIDRINRITSSYTEAEIKRIQIAYDALSSLAKSYITDAVYQKLVSALANIEYENTVVKQAKLDANAFDLYMNTVDRYSSTQEIAKARANYNRLSFEAKRHVTTLEKLVRLETMWSDPEYIELVHTYYPEYVNAVKPGAIVIEKPTYDPLYIPDDSTVTRPPSSVATSIPTTATWSQYETMSYQNGRYTTQITASQVKNIADRNMRFKAGDIEIVIPTAEIQSATATVGVSVNITNNQLNIQFTEGNNTKAFSSVVEIHVPVNSLRANTSQIIERVTAFGSSPASFKMDGANFVIRTTTSGTFRTATSNVYYTDIPNNTQGNAIRELAKRGIMFNTNGRLVQSNKQVKKVDILMMIASALDLSSTAKSKYLDIDNEQQLRRAQGLLEAGIMTGATSSRFAPNANMTKQEAAIIIANMYRYLNQDLSKAYNEFKSNYRDVANISLEARQSIAILELFGVVDGIGAFNPTKPLTRGEFAELFYKALTAIDYL